MDIWPAENYDRPEREFMGGAWDYMRARPRVIVLVAAVVVTATGSAYAKRHDLGDVLLEQWRGLLMAALITFLVGVFAVVVLGAKNRVVAALATLVCFAVGGGVVYGLAALFPSLLPFIEQRERVAARSLVGVVGNGSIAFVSSAYGNVDIYAVDPEGADTPTRLTTAQADDTDPAWSPDGARLAFARFRGNGADIYTIRADGTEEKRLTTERGADSGPAWSPDGKRIAFTSERDGNAEIYVMQADGTGEATKLTTNPAADREPAWSPDGERIAFTTFRGGDADIYVMEADGSNPRQLTTLPVQDSDPSWGPDGAHLAFVSGRKGDHEVYRYWELDGGPSVVPVTTNRTDDRWPAWSPDGGDLAFIHIDEAGKATLRVETDPKRRGEQSRLVTQMQVREARLSWQPVPRQGLELPDEGEPVFRYAPLVYLHPGEARFPMDAANFVRRSHLLCDGLREVAPSDLVATVKEHCGGRAASLILNHGFEWGSRRNIGGLYTGVPVYWERVKKPAAITYWFFYASSKTAGALGIHQGDWEGIAICLGANGQPTRVAYNQHKTGETRPWPWAPKFGTHPIVYSALGSHASYPENLGRRKKTQDLTDEGPIWPTWRTLREVTEEEWYDFVGKWGAQGDSPTGPSPKRTGGKGCG